MDAACVGASTPPILRIAGVVPLAITAAGHGVRQMCGTDRYGFPTRHRTRQTRHVGFATGDLVRAAVPAGLKTAGRHVGRVLVRASGVSIWRPAPGEYRASVIAVVGWSPGATARPTRKERRRFLPVPEGRGLRAARKVTPEDSDKKVSIWRVFTRRFRDG
jgi:hypothetical protein